MGLAGRGATGEAGAWKVLFQLGVLSPFPRALTHAGVSLQVHQDHHPHKSKSEKELPEHYVESIFVVDTESNEVAAYADFPPSFEHEYGPMLEATLSRKEKYVPYSYCNQHGLWKGEPF